MQDLEQKKTGTTTVGIVCKDAVVLASESKSTMGYLVAGKEVQKIYQIDDKIGVTIAGAVGDTQTLIRMMRAEVALYKNMRNADFTVRAAITLLSNVMQSSRYYPYYAMLVMGGHDKTGFHVYSIDPFGGAEEESKYVSTGSGSPFAYGVLEDAYREGLSKEEGMKLAIRAIKSAKERDIASGGTKINMLVITKDAAEWITEEKVKELSREK